MSDAEERTQRMERWLSIAVGLAAIVAVMVSLYQARLTREQLRASAWPYLSQGNSYTRDSPYRFVVSNQGIGPARIKSFRVLVDGHSVPTWNAAVRALTGEGEPALVYSFFGRGSVMVPGSDRALLVLPAGPRAEKFWTEAQQRLKTQVCYCSVYDECWLADGDEPEPTPQQSCSAAATQEFQQ